MLNVLKVLWCVTKGLTRIGDILELVFASSLPYVPNDKLRDKYTPPYIVVVVTDIWQAHGQSHSWRMCNLS